MKRIDIIYGGQPYSVGGRELAEIRNDVEEAIRSGGGWLKVNDGEGERRDAYLYITPGTTVALIPIPDEEP